VLNFAFSLELFFSFEKLTQENWIDVVQASKTIPLAEPCFLPSYADSVRDQILTGFVGPGKRAQEFAQALAVFVGAPSCLLTVSGTVALSVAANALGLKAGDEILVPAYGVISTINAFASIGLEPKLVDIERTTGCMSPEALLNTISENTKAVCFVNFSGYTGSNLVVIQQICNSRGIPLIEDAACALGHSYQGIKAGMFGTVGTYSFSTPKVLTTGQGGALVSSDQGIFNKAAAFIDQGDLEWRKTNINREVGSNLRFNDILAALGQCQLNDLAQRLQTRKEVYEIYKQGLEGYIYTVPGEQAPLHNIVFTSQSALLVEKLKLRGIASACQYRTLCEHPPYQRLAQQTYSNADFWTRHAAYLPFGMTLSRDDALYIVQAIKESEVELYETSFANRDQL
jgi:perosamine synthetase